MANSALSQYFPFLEHSVGEDNAALSSSMAIASVGIAMLKMLEVLLPAAANEVEHESRSMADHFTTLAHYVQQQQSVPKEVSDAMSGIVMEMQFQDRNTQVMDNVSGMLECYRSMLEEVCSRIEAVREDSEHGEQTVAHAVDNILSSIRLSDIRTRYLDALAKAKLHSPKEEEGVGQPTQDIELF